MLGGLERSVYRDSFYAYMRAAWPHIESAPYIDNWHVGAVCEHLQAVTLGQISKLLINIPPGCSKSLITCVFWPTWEWQRDPSVRWFFASYDQQLATRDSVKCRTLLSSPWYQAMWPGRVMIKRDQDQKTYYETTAGGYRLATSVGGHGTGEHPDRVCLPWESAIVTDRGVLPIGEVVDDRLPVRVLAFDHATGRPAWRRILNYEKSPPRQLCRVGFRDGTSLELTPEHPVYVVGRNSYVQAGSLIPGEVVIHVGEMSQLRRSVQQKGQQQGGLLFPSLLLGAFAEEVNVSLYAVWYADLPQSCTQGESEARGLLFAPLPRGFHTWGEASPVSWYGSEVVRYLWGAVQSGEAEGKDSGCMQPRMSIGLVAGEQPQEGEQNFCGMCLLWHEHSNLPQAGRYKEVLFTQLCQQIAWGSYAGGWQSQLRKRQLFGGIQQAVRETQKVHQGAGRVLLLPVRQDGSSEWAGLGYSSHRLRQGERLQGEFSGVVQVLPQWAQRQPEPPTAVGTKVVSSVEFSVRIPDAVYNLNVETDHNYFADGVLVHNCFDDPHNVRKAESEVERQNVIDWWDLTMPTRGLSRGVRQVGIMQRLHHRDLAGHIISRGDFVLLCLPMRYEPNRMATTVLGWNDPRTIEGELLAPAQFPEEKIRSLEKSLGAYGVAGQLQQRPQPRGGGLFKPQWFNRRNRTAPREAVRVRAWDRASTNEGGCYTAGVLMAKDKDGTLYVEDCVHGQWEPNERNDRIIATAKKDRLRYGPKWEPTIVVEMERGSTGLESFQRLAARLVGYKIKEDRPTGSKDVRAEPWADQLAAGNVVICDNGGEPLWDIANYVTEHEQFKPDSKVKRLGKYKDQVDASSMACNWLANKSAEPAEARVIRFRTTDRNKPKHPRVVVSSYASLPNIDADQKTMLTVIHDPFTEKPEEARFLPSIPNLIDTHFSAFADLNPSDYQDAWEQPVEPYGKPPAELVIAREHGKAIWKALLKPQPTPELFIFVSPNGNCADAIAKAFMDVLRIPRDGLHYADSDNEEGKHKQPPINQHVYDVMRIARGAIL